MTGIPPHKRTNEATPGHALTRTLATPAPRLGVELGAAGEGIEARSAVAVGDVATLPGPDHHAVHPNTIAENAGISVHDVLMRLSPLLPVV